MPFPSNLPAAVGPRRRATLASRMAAARPAPPSASPPAAPCAGLPTRRAGRARTGRARTELAPRTTRPSARLGATPSAVATLATALATALATTLAVTLPPALATMLATTFAAPATAAPAAHAQPPRPSSPAAESAQDPGQREPSPTAQAAEEAAAEAAKLADLTAFTEWLERYQSGVFRLMRDGRDDEEAIAKIGELMDTLARWNNLPAAKKLFEAAAVEPRRPQSLSSTAGVDFEREVQPWRVQAMARERLAKLQVPGFDEWLVSLLQGRPGSRPDEVATRLGAIRALGERPGVEPRLALLQVSRTLPPAERVAALTALARNPSLDLTEPFVELLKNGDPNVRIAALNGIGAALGPHTDQTKAAPAGAPDASAADSAADRAAAAGVSDLDRLRDTTIERVRDVLMRDRVWQVRAAAREALVALRCKQSIPALIDGLRAELARTKDPWALDVRLHRALEGMTGVKVPVGALEPWQDFWRNEGESFAFRKHDAKGKPEKTGDERYQKFFNLTVDSDRVLFVLDFSGSMAEPANLSGKVTSAAAQSVSATKAGLVVEEIKRLVLSMPATTQTNFVVFSDEVRIWRPDRHGRPALVALDDATKDDVVGRFLPSLVPRGPTNLYGALDAAFGFAGRGLHDKYYATGFDTLYVLSDGGPTAGAVTDRDEILRRVREVNALRRITVHTITFGDQNEMRFLGTLAEENGGRHIHMQ